MFMTIFRNSKNQSVFYDHNQYYVSVYRYKKVEILSRASNALGKNQRTHALLKWIKKIESCLSDLDAVKSRFLETREFIDNFLKEECEKEKITADKFRSKELARINIFVIDLYYSDYFLFIDVERRGRQ